MERNDKGRWLPGCPSPNRGGRPKGALRQIRAICLDAAESIVREMIDLALDPNVRPRDRIAAANIILDRGLGKASREMPDEQEEPLDQKTRILKLINPELREQLGFTSSNTASVPVPCVQMDRNNDHS